MINLTLYFPLLIVFLCGYIRVFRKTDYVVRPSTSSEQDLFREQELKRYMNPHKAYTFHMHGFESVVGPVKVSTRL
jgi:hypothetical protein